MKILTISDEEIPSLWEYYTPGKLADYDLIISCGDLNASYLSFLVTMARCPVLYVHGNHDSRYSIYPPEGCDCIDGGIVVYNGLRILGLGGCLQYRSGAHQYTEHEMQRRIAKLEWRIALLGGVDIVVTHAPPQGLGDGEDRAHWGFASLRKFLDQHHPKYLLHGHVHTSYDATLPRVRDYGGTTLVNTCGSYVLNVPDAPCKETERGQVIWKTKPKYSDDPCFLHTK